MDKASSNSPRIIRSTFILVLTVALWTACSGSQEPPVGRITPTGQTRSADGSSSLELVRAAVGKMNAVDSLHFELRLTTPGYPNSVFPVEGDYVRPDKAKGVIHRDGSDMGFVLGSPNGDTKLGRFYFEQDAATGSYHLVSSGVPSGLIIDFQKLEDTVAKIESASVVSEEQVGGVDTTHIKAICNCQGDASATGQSEIDLWIGKATSYIYKIGGSVEVAEPLYFTYYSRFNEPVSPPIELPTLPTFVAPSAEPVRPSPTAYTYNTFASWATLVQFTRHEADGIDKDSVVTLVTAGPPGKLDKPYSAQTTRLTVEFVFLKPNGEKFSMAVLDSDPPTLVRLTNPEPALRVSPPSAADMKELADRFAYVKLGPREVYQMTEQEGEAFAQEKKLKAYPHVDMYVDTDWSASFSVPSGWYMHYDCDDYHNPGKQLGWNFPRLTLRVDGATGKILTRDMSPKDQNGASRP